MEEIKIRCNKCKWCDRETDEEHSITLAGRVLCLSCMIELHEELVDYCICGESDSGEYKELI